MCLNCQRCNGECVSAYWLWWPRFLAGLAVALQRPGSLSGKPSSPAPTSAIRTPLLTLSVSSSRLNPHAPLNAQSAAPFLKRVV